MNPFVTLPGQIPFSPPFRMEHTRLTAIGFTADRRRLQEVLDRSFSHPSQGAVRLLVIAPVVVLVVAIVERARSDAGWMSEIDVAFWIPAMRTNGLPNLVWHLPYVWVDSETACTAGREIFGFPKQLGHFQVEQEGRILKSLKMQALSQGAGETEARVQPLLSLERVGNGSEVALPNWLAEKQSADLLFLKQFRDAERSDRACYQAVVRVPTVATQVRMAVPHCGKYQAHWNPTRWHPFVEDLGIQSNSSLYASFVDFDFVVEAGEVLWQRHARPAALNRS